MDKTTIQEGNKLIAEFMGWTFVGNRFDITWIDGEWERSRSIKATEFNYHENWSKLMPVVEKIKSIVDKKEYNKEGLLFYKEALNRYVPIRNELIKINMPNVHYCVVQFIQWYNEKEK